MRRLTVAALAVLTVGVAPACGGDRDGGIRQGKRTTPTGMLADEGRTDEQIAAALHGGLSTVARTRQRCVEEGLDAALADRPRPGAAPKLSPKQQAFTVALACTRPPEGRLRWTMQLLADRLVELEVIPAISDEAIRRLLKKTR